VWIRPLFASGMIPPRKIGKVRIVHLKEVAEACATEDGKVSTEVF
jgi:hypothetical protein